MAKFNNFTETGSTGLAVFSGQIEDEFLRELRGLQGYKRYDEMRRNSAVVGALLTAIELMVRGVRWSFTSNQGQDDPRLELLNTSLDGMSRSWNDHISEALSMLPFGWSLFEIVYQRDPQSPSRIIWHKFAMRGQDTLYKWEFEDNGSLAGFTQTTKDGNYKPVTIPIEKCLLYRTRVERNNPEGRSILRNAWVSYYYLKNIQQVEAIGIERDLAGMPVIHLPPGADTTDSTTSDYGKAKKMVRNIRRDEQEGIVLPENWKLDLLASAGSRQFDTNTIVQRYESRILMSALAQFLILGQNNVGTQALSKDMSELFDVAVDSIVDSIGETFNKYAVPRLLALNGYDAEGISLDHTPVGGVDLSQLGLFMTQVANQLTWTPQDELWLRQVANLPSVEVEDIEAERDRKRSVAAQISGAINKPGEEDEEDTERMAAEYYAAVPDETERNAWERRYQRLWQSYLTDQQKRVVNASRSLRNG